MPTSNPTSLSVPAYLELWTSSEITTSSSLDITTSSSSSSSSLEEGDEQVSRSNGNDTNNNNTRHFQLLGLITGILVGCFIQLSSLGANYLLTELFGCSIMSAASNDDASSRSIIGFSLIWSLLTSIMGVMILLIVRSLMVMATGSFMQYNNNNKRARDFNSQVILQVECYFAVGTLVGVCLSWTCADLWMGLQSHLMHSLATLVAALVWCKAVSNCCLFRKDRDADCVDEDEDIQDNLTKHLLDEERNSSGEDDDDDDECYDDFIVDLDLFKYESIVLGVLVGFYIQFSSLGANFLLGTMTAESISASSLRLILSGIPDNEKYTFFFSLIWSTVTSGMGIMILVVVRKLIYLAYKTATTERQRLASAHIIRDAVVQLECSFAVGALVGVNSAWVATDLMLNLHVQYMHSALTLFLALLWCKSVSVCMVRNDECEDDGEEIDEVDDELEQEHGYTRPLLY